MLMSTNKVSVIIPSINEPYLTQTIRDVLLKAAGEVEVIAIIDGKYPEEEVDDKRVKYRHFQDGFETGHGKRQCMNAGALIATGKYFFFLDAHCMVCEGFDEILKADCDDNWIVTPRRYKLDPEKWAILEDGKGAVDYMYLCYPPRNPNKTTIDGFPWRERAIQRLNIEVDDDMINQGSACFMTSQHFFRMGFMDVKHFGGNFQESQETCLKTWLSGGRVVRNKKTWYAHWRKRHRGWDLDMVAVQPYLDYSTDLWMNNRDWPGKIYDLEWLINKFWPVPTWPKNWTEDWKRRNG